jgi:hypothetical protein
MCVNKCRLKSDTLHTLLWQKSIQAFSTTKANNIVRTIIRFLTYNTVWRTINESQPTIVRATLHSGSMCCLMRNLPIEKELRQRDGVDRSMRRLWCGAPAWWRLVLSYAVASVSEIASCWDPQLEGTSLESQYRAFIDRRCSLIRSSLQHCHL